MGSDYLQDVAGRPDAASPRAGERGPASLAAQRLDLDAIRNAPKVAHRSVSFRLRFQGEDT
jgi:hypothetical protein